MKNVLNYQTIFNEYLTPRFGQPPVRAVKIKEDKLGLKWIKETFLCKLDKMD